MIGPPIVVKKKKISGFTHYKGVVEYRCHSGEIDTLPKKPA